MKIKYYCLLLLCFGIGMGSHADEDAASALYQKIKVIDNIVADFDQRIEDHEGYVVQASKGNLVLKRPNLIYWRTAPPYEQVVVGDGDKVSVYDPDLEQVTIHESDKAMEGPMMLLAQSLDQLQSRFAVTLEQKKKQLRFSLRPLSETRDAFEVLVFVFNEDGLVVIEMLDRLRQKTEITLKNVKQNTAVNSKLFNFTAPEGVEIVVND